MKAKDRINENSVIIFWVDEWGDGRVEAMDGNVLYVQEKRVAVIYLSGHRSRTDLIPWKDIIACVDKRKPYIKLENTPFSGRFQVFD